MNADLFPEDSRKKNTFEYEKSISSNQKTESLHIPIEEGEKSMKNLESRECATLPLPKKSYNIFVSENTSMIKVDLKNYINDKLKKKTNQGKEVPSIYGKILLDSGAQVNCVTKKFYEKLLTRTNSDMSLNEWTGRIVPLGKNAIQDYGYFKFPLLINGSERVNQFNLEFVVVENLGGSEAILGMPGLETLQVSLHFGIGVADILGKKFHFFKNPICTMHTAVRLSEDINLLPRTMKKVPVFTEERINSGNRKGICQEIVPSKVIEKTCLPIAQGITMDDEIHHIFISNTDTSSHYLSKKELY